MPVYNAEAYLRVCLDSILQQTIDQWELIAVDDFSTDGSYTILQAYADKDDRITVLRNTEKGIIPALQRAYQHSAGRYITRMDADDIMMPEKLEALYMALQNRPGHCSTGLVQYFAEGGVQEGYQKYAEWLNSLHTTAEHYAHIYRECVVPSPCWMMERTTVESIGAMNFRQYPEDYDLVFRMYQAVIPIVKVDSVLHRWRDHHSRASRNDPNYADQHFFELKLNYFFEIDYDPRRPLVLWGTGRTGKALAQKLLDRGVQFQWVTNNKNKIGHQVYGVHIEHQDLIFASSQYQIITAVKQRGFKTKNKHFFEKLSKENDLFQFV